MRPIKLTMTAFGPYAGKQEIDFEQLNGRNIFLITGPTGAGKTTIFDGISYAIYGRASGEDRDGENLRSQFADVDILTAVELEFELRGKRYYIKRIPKQMKPKTRGEGLTEQKSDAELQILDEDNSKTLSGVTDVNDKIEELMVINRDQFTQIMMIPQGEFRKLLTADSKEREKILQRIFGTQAYKFVESKLNERARTLKKDIELLEHSRLDQVKRIEFGENDGLKALVQAESLNMAALLEALEEQVKRDEHHVGEITKQITNHDKTLEKQQKKLYEGKQINEKFKEKATIEEQKKALEEKGKEIETKEQVLQRAKKVQGLMAVEESYLEKKNHRQDKEAALKQSMTQLEASEKRAKVLKAQLEDERDKEDIRQKLSENITTLKGYGEKVENFEAKRVLVEKLQQTLKKADTEKKVTKTKLVALKETLEDLAKKIEGAREAQGNYIEGKAELDRFNQIYKQMQYLHEENQKVNGLRKQFVKIQSHYQRDKKAYDNLKEHFEKQQALWFKGQAGILAKNLKDGCACPVCGSEHHPDVASIESGVPTEEALNGEKEKVASAEKQLRATEEKFIAIKGDGHAQQKIVQKAKEALDGMVEASIKDLDRDDLTAYIEKAHKNLLDRIKTLEVKVKKLEGEKNGLEKLLKEQEHNKKAYDDLEKAFEKMVDTYNTTNTNYEREKGVFEALMKELPENIRSKEALEKAIKEVESKHRTMMERLKKVESDYNQAQIDFEKAKTVRDSSLKDVATAKESFEGATKKFEEKRLEAGFDSLEAYTKAKMKQDEIEALERGIQNYYQKLKSMVDAYDKATKAIEGLEMVDVSVLEKKLEDMKTGREDLSNKKTSYQLRIEQHRKVLAAIDTLEKDIKDREKAYGIVGDLAEVAKGNNPQGMTFERYVLAAFLDQILEAANLRLRRMTNNRYEMSRTNERARSNAQSGLELEVFDHYTGMSRHVKTLSGGEGFKAALSLALGLSDVVQAYAGGITLDTMFIDEGFGTLDPESLDSAIETLADLQSSGRLVGIISHVPELKERIDARLEVQTTNQGSKAQFYVM